MSGFYKPYVPVAERRRLAAKTVAGLAKNGEAVQPVAAATPRGKIAASFWGQAWCEHLESYSDYVNRLPRGRTYLRNGSVLHLAIEQGAIKAMVMGSELYEQMVRIQPLPKSKWEALKERCQGKIGSLVELLQGKLSSEIMAIVTDRNGGLFPAPNEIRLDCSCPDWADLCKHLAAVLYGVGARLDECPELLFKLRGVDHTELIQADASALVTGQASSSGRRRLSVASVNDVFGIEMVAEDVPVAAGGVAKASPSPEHTAVSGAAPAQPKKSARIETDRKKSRQPSSDLADALNRIEEAKAELDRAMARIGGVDRRKKKRGTVKTARKQARPAFVPTGPAVRNLRDQLGLSRSAFARALGVSITSVSNWEAKSGEFNLQTKSLNALRKLHDSI